MCVIVCTFQPGNYTGWGSEGVNCSRIRTDLAAVYVTGNGGRLSR